MSHIHEQFLAQDMDSKADTPAGFAHAMHRTGESAGGAIGAAGAAAE